MSYFNRKNNFETPFIFKIIPYFIAFVFVLIVCIWGFQGFVAYKVYKAAESTESIPASLGKMMGEFEKARNEVK